MGVSALESHSAQTAEAQKVGTPSAVVDGRLADLMKTSDQHRDGAHQPLFCEAVLTLGLSDFQS